MQLLYIQSVLLIYLLNRSNFLLYLPGIDIVLLGNIQRTQLDSVFNPTHPELSQIRKTVVYLFRSHLVEIQLRYRK